MASLEEEVERRSDENRGAVEFLKRMSLFRKRKIFVNLVCTASRISTLYLLFLLPTLVGCGAVPKATQNSLANVDRTAEIQEAVDQGGTVTFPAGTYFFTRTIVPRKSNTVIQGVGPQTVFVFTPSLPLINCVNDRAFTTPCDVQRRIQGNSVVWTPRRQIAAPISLGDKSFATLEDVSDISAGDWLIIEERDPNISDIVVVDWVQVASASGRVIGTGAPFRTAFPDARPWDPVFSGLGFLKIPELVSGIQFRDFTLIVPDVGEDIAGISVFAAVDTLIENVFVRDENGQPLYSYMSKGLTIRNSAGSCGQTLNEFGATVDFAISDSTLSCDRGAGFGLDQGSGFFEISGNTVPTSEDTGIYLLHGVHDGSISRNSIAFVHNDAPGYNSIGILSRGSARTTITGNYLFGGAGLGSVGISIGDDDFLAVPIPSQGNTVMPNSFGAGWNTDYDPNNRP